jgi:hypothetical protein
VTNALAYYDCKCFITQALELVNDANSLKKVVRVYAIKHYAIVTFVHLQKAKTLLQKRLVW